MQQQQQQFQESLTQPASLILSSLLDGPKKAVALREAIEYRTGLVMEPGTLYRLLAHLEQRGWIEGLRTEEPLRLYRLTALCHLTFQNAGMGSYREYQRDGGSPFPLDN
jgi:DNA-binding PadR family transcriptional regulator